ncbi:MAG TPA: hypothetical protein PLU71_04570 [Candidatus Dependentiae bacterium]|nr:hypothetical protein [Candidatus Dependentiae bacterium]HRQ63107.1 hypothetical protein [Candidatus Dependentiae bacterium]
MKKFLVLLLCAGVSVSYALHDGFVLITTLYNEQDSNRAAEFITCLEKNLSHPGIDTIHVLYDTTKDTDSNYIHDILCEKTVNISYCIARPTYGACFELANQLYAGRRIIIANADIYFNATLFVLDHFDLTNKFLALTRWNVQKDGSIKPYIWPNGQPAIASQDAWVFRAPLVPFIDDAIFIGTHHCDGRIAYEAQRVGLDVLNPCLTIQCCHLHLSEVRNYEWLPYPHGHAVKLPWVELPVK